MPAHHGKFVSYYRVSTDRQGRSGLGLDAQKEAVQPRLDGGRWHLIADVEIESGKRAKLASLPRRHRVLDCADAAQVSRAKNRR